MPERQDVVAALGLARHWEEGTILDAEERCGIFPIEMTNGARTPVEREDA